MLRRSNKETTKLQQKTKEKKSACKPWQSCGLSPWAIGSPHSGNKEKKKNKRNRRKGSLEEKKKRWELLSNKK